MSSKGKHSSLEKDLIHPIRLIEGLEYVTKTALGPIIPVKHKYTPGHVIYRQDIPAGAKLRGYSGIGIRDIYVYTSPPNRRDNLKDFINEHFV